MEDVRNDILKLFLLYISKEMTMLTKTVITYKNGKGHIHSVTIVPYNNNFPHIYYYEEKMPSNKYKHDIEYINR
jgi:hypothetical protein